MSYRKYRYNIYPKAWKAINQNTFPWHQAEKIHSSQALAIDVFGTIKQSSNQNLFLYSLMEKIGLKRNGEWVLNLEWKDPDNLVQEPRQTQVDATAWNDSHILFFESKFTETSGGSCNQVKPLMKGPNKGKIQCNGQYKIQTNPVNNIESKCALTGKNIRYWEYVDKIFKTEIYSTKGCPFSGSWYQWMRNLTVCYAVAENQGKKPVFILTYVDGINFPIAQEIDSKEWLRFTGLIKSDEILLMTISYQELLQIYADIIYSNDTENHLLVDWVESKIKMVEILKKFKTIT